MCVLVGGELVQDLSPFTVFGFALRTLSLSLSLSPSWWPEKNIKACEILTAFRERRSFFDGPSKSPMKINVIHETFYMPGEKGSPF